MSSSAAVPIEPDDPSPARLELPRGLLVGYQVGRFRLVERLGGGVMAAVYRAVDVETDHPVAVKVLLPDADAIVRERFRQEARTHGQLHHPNIVPILDEGHEAYSGITFLAMMLVEGPGLNGLIEEHERLQVHDAAAILAPVARALAHAHHRGIIHRDVKPSNVLLQRAASDQPGAVFVAALGGAVVPMLSDFGIARALDSPELTGVGRTIGTPTYMSPEQCADSHDLDQRSDLYSLGAVFYRCLVGRPPFTGSTTQILHAHVYEPLMIPEAVLSELPGPAVEILRRSLAKEPALRFAHADEMAAALAQLAKASPSPTALDAATDVTSTMAALPAVRTPTPMQILVPGILPRLPEAGGGDLVAVEMGAAPAAAPSPAAAPTVGLPSSAPALTGAHRRRRWVGALLGAALAALVVGGAIWTVMNLLPADLLGDGALPAGVAVADVATSLPARVTPPATTGVSTAPARAATPEAVQAQRTPAAATTSVIAGDTPAQLPTPSGAIEGYLAEAEDAYRAQDWQVALDNFTLVQRIDATFQRDSIVLRLFDVHVGLATEAIAVADFARAAASVQAALDLRGDAEPLRQMRAALARLAAAEGAGGAEARQELWSIMVTYAEQLAQADAFCGAAAQLRAAAPLRPDSGASDRLQAYDDACSQSRLLADIDQALAGAGGSILYSTQEGSRYNIYAAPAQAASPSTLLLADGAQVGVARDGLLLVFRNTAAPGIYLYDRAASLAPDDRTRRLTTAPEDAVDAPPSWSPDGSLVVYGSTRLGDRRPHIFVHTLESGAEVDLGLGKDPAWEPTGPRIVYNGLDARGEQPGLYIMNRDGENRLRLTDNGNDIRPVWSPDGFNIVFMSTRRGNWDVYRLSLRDGSLKQLTDDPAQDGLPAISPDGRFVVFASDRGGVWRLYVTPIDGGPTASLLTVNGVLTNWLEHSIQWTQ